MHVVLARNNYGEVPFVYLYHRFLSTERFATERRIVGSQRQTQLARDTLDFAFV